MGNIAALGNTVVQTTPVGVIEAFAGVNAPAGWLFCDGSAISRIQYPELFSALSTTYGSGDGSTTFNIPDLRGRVPAGKDNMGGVAANRLTSANSGITATSLGANGGDERLHQHTHTQNAHGHTVTNIKWTASSHTHQNTGGYFAEAPWPAGGDATPAGVPATTATNQNTGSGNSQNVQPTLIVNYIIKAVADLPRGGWFYQNQPPVVTQLPANPQIGEEVYFYNSTTSGYQHKKYNGTSWTTFDDSGAISITDNSGRVRLPYQPVFSGRVTSGGYKGNVTIVMNAANINRGNHYDTSTGFFTCPIAGAYLCMFQGIFSASPGYGYIYIRKNNSNTDQYAHYNDNTGDWRNPSVNGVVDCNAGDTLSFYVQTVNSNAGLYGSAHNSGTIMYLG